MTRTLAFAAALALTFSSAAFAKAPCRDAHGRFAKCPPAAAAPKHCRDAKTGRFAKCDAPGARPA